jgi:Ca2+-binding EF-hand superfamily protein
MRDVVEKLGPKLSEDEVTEILNELDVQGKGQISVSLFAESMMKF